MAVCEVCERDRKQGYRINPSTGYPSEGFWCDDDYELLAARNTRDGSTRKSEAAHKPLLE